MDSLEFSDSEERDLTKLHYYGIDSEEGEVCFERILRVVSRSLQVPLVMLSFLEAQRVIKICCEGFDLKEVPPGRSLCGQVILSDDPMVVEDASITEAFGDHPLVANSPFVKFFLGAPLITADGHRIGALCAMDLEPRTPKDSEIALLQDFASLVIDKVELRKSQRDLKKTKDRLHEKIGDLLDSKEQLEEQAISIAELSEQLTQQKQENERINPFDPLTGLPNARMFLASLDKEKSRSERYGPNFSLIVFSPDRQQNLRDDAGQEALDILLVSAGTIAQELIRHVDVIGRISMDSFGIICPETTQEKAYILAERLRKIIEEIDFPLAGDCTASLGIAQFQRGEDVGALLARAQAALGISQQQGGNLVTASEIEVQQSA